jgi:SAM-dependent methyltransferase
VLCADASATPLPDAAVDLVVAFMSLHDMDDMAGAVREIGRVLRPGGRLCLAVVHPLNQAGGFRSDDADEFVISDDYFRRRRTVLVQEKRGLRMTFEAMHRPLQDYFAALEAAGLLTEAVREVRSMDGTRWERLPLFLDARAVRP